MTECRYWPRCKDEAWCDGKGALEGFPEGTRCKRYRPMPDVAELTELAENLDKASGSVGKNSAPSWMLSEAAKVIRKAIGKE